MVTKVQRQDSICMHVHCSKTEQASEITMTPALAISSHYTNLVACMECMWTINYVAIMSLHCVMIKAGIISEACSVLLLCVKSLLNLVFGAFVTIPFFELS